MNRFVVQTTCCWAVLAASAFAQVIPHNQERPPGPALSPAQAIAKMRVPEHFAVKLFAAEPDVVNPVAMTFDARGRVWITESLEYPRLKTGTGRDRIKILEDTDRDGKADKITIFAEGLNIPSGIALGYGGVFVANSPDLLFLRDTDGDDKADAREVLLTGFGRSDTHELPNCLTWGPDGWLYGLNGVFNTSKIVHQGKTHEFTCALWRYQPRTRQFDLFAEGTSNPWGLDYDQHGNFFVSACVIDHLWHLTETGYYHRQAGAYPPFTWKIESIVDHRHQKAAYCGLCYFDGDAYPQEYRGTMFMGNIHGNCINRDGLRRRGASYLATSRPDPLTANDVWFMPVVQKVGPDGCLWIVDWYDRYHCYQDARRDPGGIDRLKGRIYRLVYRHTPMPQSFDLTKVSDADLIERLGHENVFYRRLARQLLIERGGSTGTLEGLVADDAASQTLRTEALWTLVSQGSLRPAFHASLLRNRNSTLRAWGVRTAGSMGTVDAKIREGVLALACDPHPGVRLQVAIASRKLAAVEPLPTLMTVLAAAHRDQSGLSPRIVWRNLEPLLEKDSGALVAWLGTHDLKESPAVVTLMDRIVERVLSASSHADGPLFSLLDYLFEQQSADRKLTGRTLETLLNVALNRQLQSSTLSEIRARFGRTMQAHSAGTRDDPRSIPSLGFIVLFKDDTGAAERAISLVQDKSVSAAARVLLLRALVAANHERAIGVAAEMLRLQAREDGGLLRSVLSAISASVSPEVAHRLLDGLPDMRPQLKPQVLDVLTSRRSWAAGLVDAVEAERIAKTDVNVNQLRKMINLGDEHLTKRVESLWGKVRLQRNRNRELVIAQMRRVLNAGSGNADSGVKVFEKVCAQCHKLHGKGNEVGPELTGVGRSSLSQLLSNLLDPNLVIGNEYRGRVLVTTDGQVETGLVVEDSPQRVVLRIAGGKEKVYARDRIEALKVSQVSLMPEDLEKQLKPQEFRDLIAFLVAEKSPGR